MDLRICEYCGMDYSADEAICPICGRPASPTAAVIPAPKAANRKKGGARLAKGGKFSAGRTAAPKRAAAPDDGENPYAIPKWMMVVICVLLALAVLAGALFALYSVGYFTEFADLQNVPDSTDTADAASGTSDTSAAQQAQPQKATEKQYINEEDYQPSAEEETADRSVPCTGIALGTATVTFQEAEQFFNITVTTQPAGCTEEVVFSSADDRIATVNQQGKILAVSGGSTEITATCGAYSASCLITCDFTSPELADPADETAPVLSSTDMTFTYPNQQATLMVSNISDDAEVLFSSSDASVATVSSSGVITAVGSGTATITVQTLGQSLECIVRCNLSGAAENPEDASYTLSHLDVTMSIKGEYFRLSLRDADGDKVTGLVWTSADESVCTVDENGVVTAAAKGTTTVGTTYEGVTYECIVRCNIG